MDTHLKARQTSLPHLLPFSTFLFVSLAVYCGTICAQQPNTSLLDVFPQPTFQLPLGETKNERTHFSSDYRPSGSLWAPGLNESSVFFQEMRHVGAPQNSFSLRIGRGGQIYSLRGPFGESVPPSRWDGNKKKAPWNDEVWQMVAVCSKYNGANKDKKLERMLKNSKFRSSFFVHGSGCYDEDSQNLLPIYCPMLAHQVDPTQRTFRCLNWGLVPQAKSLHRSPLLYYLQVRDVGQGIIELTWVAHNFSTQADVVFDFLNVPWGGTRVTSLPYHYLSKPDGSWEDISNPDRPQVRNGLTVDKTGGWTLALAEPNARSPALALVFGRDKHLSRERALKNQDKPFTQFAPSIFRGWRAARFRYDQDWSDWNRRPPNSFRNYDVMESIAKCKIRPGDTFYWRSYLVVNSRDVANDFAKQLVDHVDYGLLNFKEPSDERSPRRLISNGRGRALFSVLTQPARGTLPVFQLRHKLTGQTSLTTDPYYFTKRQPADLRLPIGIPLSLEKDPKYEYWQNAVGYSMDENVDFALIGFASKTRPTSGNWVRLSDLHRAGQVGFDTNETAFHRDVWVRVD